MINKWKHFQRADANWHYDYDLIDDSELIVLDISQFGVYQRKIKKFKIEFEESQNPSSPKNNWNLKDNKSNFDSNSDSEGEDKEEIMKIGDIEELIEWKKPRKPMEPNPKYWWGTGCFPWIFDTYDDMWERYEKKVENYKTKVDEFWKKFNVRYEDEQ